MARVVVFGTGQSAEVAAFYLTHDSPHEVVGFTVDGTHLDRTTFVGRPVVPFEDVVDAFPPADASMLVSIAYTRVNRLRAERYAAAKSMGYRLISYVSSRASTWSPERIGENCMIAENVTIQPFASVGHDVVIGPGCSVGHHATIGDHVYLASHVTVSGYSSIGDHSFLGANSTIRDGVAIGADNVIGASVSILTDTQPRAVYASPRAALLPIPSDKLPRI